MIKKILSLNIALIILLLTSCKNSTTSLTSSTNSTNTSGTTSTTKVSTNNLSCKALNNNYDQDNLNYQLVWSDEFDGDTLDTSKWSYETGGNGFGNNELQYYTNGDNLTIKDGILTIEARKEKFNRNEYTSSKIVTRNKASWLYGKFEVRAKLPKGRGTWPAIWMMPTTSSYGIWPRSGEIDIMEHVGYDMNRVYGTVHTASYNHKNGTQKGGSKIISNVDSEFHIYSIEWLPDKIDFFIDGQFYYRFRPSIFVDCPSSEQWPFDKSFYLIMNLAVGGDWGGAKGVDENIWPQTLEIDYVRVYQSEIISNIN